ncbi:MAG TPA: glycosyltransferase family 2 protein [Trueperaceae bacterium]
MVVTFNPRESLFLNMRLLSAETNRIILIDNGSTGQSMDVIELAQTIPQLELIRLPENQGLATALNMGIKAAIQQGFEWIATFDQDSAVTPNYFKGLLRAFESCPNTELVASISPRYMDEVSGTVTSFATRCHADTYCFVKASRTSGTLYRASIFGKVGFFRDDFFIDCIDVEYFLRCRAAGFYALEAPHVRLVHNLGQTASHRLWFLDRTVTVTHHSCLRRYYMTRNRITVYRRYVSFDPLWVWNDLLGTLKQMVKIVLFEDLVLCKLLATFQGLIDGILGKAGPKHRAGKSNRACT